MTAELAEGLGLDRQVMDTLVQEALVVQRARAEGLEATDDEVNAEINAQSVFHENGRFTRRRFEAILKRAGIRESAYVEDVRRELTSQRMRGLVPSGVKVTPAEVGQALVFGGGGVGGGWGWVGSGRLWAGGRA